MGMDRRKMRLPNQVKVRGRVKKRTYAGRYIKADFEEVGGVQYARSFHATKGWRRRRLPKPGARAGVIHA